MKEIWRDCEGNLVEFSPFSKPASPPPKEKEWSRKGSYKEVAAIIEAGMCAVVVSNFPLESLVTYMNTNLESDF